MSKRKWPKPIEEDGRFHCPVEDCDKDYATKGGYRKHMRNKHSEVRTVMDGVDIPPKMKEKIIEIEEEENIIGSKEEELKLGELYETLQQFGKKMQEMDIVQDTINVQAEAGFILIVGLSDLHMGMKGVNYEYIDRLLEFVNEHPRVFAYINGDLIANWVDFSPDSGGYDEILPPKYQNKLAEHKINQIKDSLLWIIQGNQWFPYTVMCK